MLHYVVNVQRAHAEAVDHIQKLGLQGIEVSEQSIAAVIPQNPSHQVAANDIPPTYVWKIGCKNPKKIWYIESGMHGVELGAGCIAQEEILRLIARDPYFLEHNLVVFVCNVNPLGAFLDDRNGFTAEGQRADAARHIYLTQVALSPYLEKILTLDAPDFWSVAKSVARLCLREIWNPGATHKDILMGQTTRPDLDFYAADKPPLPAKLTHEILTSLINDYPNTDIIRMQLHSGDGQYGKSLCYIDKENDFLYKVLQQATGVPPTVLVRLLGETFTENHFLKDIFNSLAARYVGFVLEFGTSALKGPFHKLDSLILILLRTSLYKNPDHPNAPRVIGRFWEGFSPSDPAWEESVRNEVKRIWGILLWLSDARTPSPAPAPS